MIRLAVIAAVIAAVIVPASAHALCHVTTRADPRCTTGTTLPGVTVHDVCTPGWATAHRNVSSRLKDEIYHEYGITHHLPYSYEIDHLIPLELGGSNDPHNLWPESQPAATTKDVLERSLHSDVCSGRVSLRHAWHLFRRRYVRR